MRGLNKLTNLNLTLWKLFLKLCNSMLRSRPFDTKKEIPGQHLLRNNILYLIITMNYKLDLRVNIDF